MPLRLTFLLSMAAALLGPSGADAASQPKVYRGEYSLSFLGLQVARATFDSRIDGESYLVKGSVSSAGLARLFDDTRGTLTASGGFAGEATRPHRFRARYVSGKEPALIDISFAGGKVDEVVNVPEPNKRDWVPLRPGDLEAVADPMAAMLVPAASPESVCGRTVKLFDGVLRADLRLDMLGTGEISTPAYSGATATCRVGFEPVSGYRKGRRALEFLKTRSRMTVVFAEIGETGIYAPIHATVGTEIGTITVRARRFEALD